MKHFTYCLLLSVLAWACGNGAGVSASNDIDDTAINSTGSYAAAATPAPLPPMPACYLNITEQDSMLLRLRSVNADGEISGDLNYRTKKKEVNSGTFFGRMKGDTLLANYSYLHKGKRKIREVAFVRQGNEWVEGSGPSAERGGVRRFDDPGSLDYRGGVYRQVACK